VAEAVLTAVAVNAIDATDAEAGEYIGNNDIIAVPGCAND
tara:strand:- start:126 stop:245 length:120 start_codon:yes stop_codon:yes gene_type:complete